MRKIGILGVAAAAVSLAGVLPQSAVADEHPIVIGFAIALSGWMEQYDQGSRFAEFAIEEINARGGLLGRQLTTIYADNKTDPAQSARAGIDVVAKDADLVIVSCDYDIGGPAALIAQNAGKISFSLCAEDPKMGIEGVGPLSFTASSAAQVQAASMAEWAHQEKGFRSAYSLINVATEWGKSLCHGFKYTWERLPGTTYLGEDTFKHEDTNFAAQITRIKNLSQMPDAIMICGFPPSGATAVRQIRAAGIDTAILSGQGMDGEFWLESVPNLSSFYLTTIASLYGDDPNAKLEGLSKRFEGQYGERPATAYIFPGYALIELWARAVELAGTTDAQAVVDELNKFRNEPTLLGPRSFSEDLHIQVQAQYLIMQIQDGKYSRIGYWTNSEPISQDLLFRR